jgi:hypothetical protein
LQDKQKTILHLERHFGSKIKFLVLGMKLPNSRSFAIISEKNKRGLTLEDNTIVNVLVYRCNEREGQHPGANDGASAGIAHAGDQLLENVIFADFKRNRLVSFRGCTSTSERDCVQLCYA